ncbi:helix-turn-helix transcriptional regulator [bacterium]|nr:helix-turn-helix transcriptional regulator [bacterium]
MNNKIDELSKRFGKRIKIERINQEISQEKLAELAGLHRTTLGTIENGKTSPTLDTIAKIANALNLTISELLLNI